MAIVFAHGLAQDDIVYVDCCIHQAWIPARGNRHLNFAMGVIKQCNMCVYVTPKCMRSILTNSFQQCSNECGLALHDLGQNVVWSQPTEKDPRTLAGFP